MPRKAAKRQSSKSAIDTLRALMTLDGEDVASIVSTSALQDARGLVARGITLLQRWNEERFGSAFLRELEEMRVAGKIRDDFERTDAGVSSLREFFELIDGKPDEDRFRAFCALFMSANALEADTNEALLDMELMAVLRRLSAGEMRLLAAIIRIGAGRSGNDVMEEISKALGHRLNVLVQKNIAVLIEQGLIERTKWQNLDGAHGEGWHLLTDLGVALSERVKRYNEFKDSRREEPKADAASGLA